MEYISFLKDWAVNIVILFILISFLEIILPSGNMKRFLDMVIGILVIIAIMSPIIKLLNKNKDIDIDKSLLTSSVETMNISYKENDDLLAAQKEQVITAYKNKLKREIEEINRTDPKLLGKADRKNKKDHRLFRGGRRGNRRSVVGAAVQQAAVRRSVSFAGPRRSRRGDDGAQKPRRRF